MSAIVTDRPTVNPTWRQPALALGLAFLALLLLYRDTAAAMVGIWSRSDTFAHAFLVPPISLWLIWRQRQRLWSVAPAPSPMWLLPMALAALAWLLGELVSVNALTQFALVAQLVLLVPLVCGWPATRVVLFPLLFLFFSVPFGEFLTPLLMEHTADFTVAALRLSGVPVYREGLQFVIPSGSWSVVEACSGIRYLIASLMVGSLFAYLNYRSPTRRLIFVGVSIAVPIVANWLRSYMIVMLGHLSDNRIATGVDHLVYGWVFFGVVITIMFMIGARWAEPDAPPPEPGRPLAIDPAGWARLAGPVLAALVLAALPQGGLQQARQQVSQAQPRLAWPMPAQAGWSLLDRQPDFQPRFDGASSRVDAFYERQGRVVGLHLAYYRGQGPERKLVSSQNVLVGSKDEQWSQLGLSALRPDGEPAQPAWRVAHLLSRGSGLAGARIEQTVWQSYWVDGRFTASDVMAKALGAKALLAGHGDDAAAVIVYTASAPAEGGNALLADFVRSHLPAIEQTLRQARDRR